MSENKLAEKYPAGSLERKIVEFSTSESIEQEVPKFFRVAYIVLWVITAGCLVETIYKYVPIH